jgi:MerR family transcriptional regulator/heat shock protein HspR
MNHGERLQQIQRLVSDLGVNLAGVEVILRLRERLDEIVADRQRLEAEVTRLKALASAKRSPRRASGDDGQVDGAHN